VTQRPAARGFTLLELLVVLVVLALAAAVALPALRSPDAGPALVEGLLARARAAAAARGETIRLRIERSGEWQIEGDTPTDTVAIETGRIEPFAGLPLGLIVSPTGSCGLEATSVRRAEIRLDPLTCEITSS
jgi:prepilin-type N-terminal cleavage/methylation domain-containing protein